MWILVRSNNSLERWKQTLSSLCKWKHAEASTRIITGSMTTAYSHRLCRCSEQLESFPIMRPRIYDYAAEDIVTAVNDETSRA